MLHDQGLPLHLWAEACNTSVFVHNIIPRRILGMSTLEEDFLGKKLEVAHFKIFGSLVYLHVTKYSRNKLEPTVDIGIFLGYIDTPHNYRVYLLNSRRTVVKRDVKFDEEKAM